MPYITKTERVPYQDHINKLAEFTNVSYEEKGGLLKSIISSFIFGVYFKKDEYLVTEIFGKDVSEDMIKLVNELADSIPTDYTKRCGHMNYVISRFVSKSYGDKALRYYEWNQILGVFTTITNGIVLYKAYGQNADVKGYEWDEIFGFLSGAEKEIYRRYVGPYEDSKINDPSCGDLLEV